jgi:hypothetical protein
MVNDVKLTAGQAGTLGRSLSLGEPIAGRNGTSSDVPAPDAVSASDTVEVSSGLYADVVAQQEGRFADRQKLSADIRSAEAAVGAIKQRLEQIIKQYPPYPPDNPERVLLLNQVNGLRKQVESLEFPAPEQNAGAAPVTLQLGFGQIDPAKTPDSQIAGYYEKVLRAQGQIAGLRPQLSPDVEAQAHAAALALKKHFGAAANDSIGANREILSNLV